MTARRTMRTLVLMTALLLAFCVAKAAPPATASNSLYWGVNASTGCYYYGDGTVSYVAACLRSDGWYDMYEANNSQWIYRGLGYWDTNSCFSFWGGGDTIYTFCPQVVQQSPLNYSGIGGSGYSTGNATIDSINNAYIIFDKDIWRHPACVYVEGNTCHVN